MFSSRLEDFNDLRLACWLFIIHFAVAVAVAIVIVIVVALVVVIAIAIAPTVDALKLRGMLAMIESSDQLCSLAPQRSASPSIRRVGAREAFWAAARRA